MMGCMSFLYIFMDPVTVISSHPLFCFLISFLLFGYTYNLCMCVSVSVSVCVVLKEDMCGVEWDHFWGFSCFGLECLIFLCLLWVKSYFCCSFGLYTCFIHYIKQKVSIFLVWSYFFIFPLFIFVCVWTVDLFYFWWECSLWFRVILWKFTKIS